MSEDLLIRPATSSDLSDLLSLYHDLNPDDLTAEASAQQQTYARMLAQPGLTVLLAFLDGKPVATLTLVIVPNLTRACAPYALVENVVTLTSCRGKGIGKRVMKAAIDLSWEAGCFKIMLMSGSGNRTAHGFYENMGFKRSKVGFELRQPGYAPRKIT
ncbi:GNAT family N-acetyltransferase [Roseibium sp.]|uniref:GNAT family N-acetyltransferase n=1 Tax=Roseibium sp. TaxID=1936156 RepID=UPI003BAC24ED